MSNVNGSITLNGVTDAEMARIWEMKAKHGSKFNFVPGFTPNPPVPRPGQPYQQQQQQQHQPVTYSNVMFTWSDPAGLSIVHEVITYLLKKEEKTEAALAQ